MVQRGMDAPVAKGRQRGGPGKEGQAMMDERRSPPGRLAIDPGQERRGLVHVEHGERHFDDLIDGFAGFDEIGRNDLREQLGLPGLNRPDFDAWRGWRFAFAPFQRHGQDVLEVRKSVTAPAQTLEQRGIGQGADNHVRRLAAAEEDALDPVEIGVRDRAVEADRLGFGKRGTQSGEYGLAPGNLFHGDVHSRSSKSQSPHVGRRGDRLDLFEAACQIQVTEQRGQGCLSD